MQACCRQHDREIGSLSLGERARIRDDSPHMSLVMGRVPLGLVLCKERRKPGLPLRRLLYYHAMRPSRELVSHCRRDLRRVHGAAREDLKSLSHFHDARAWQHAAEIRSGIDQAIAPQN